MKVATLCVVFSLGVFLVPSKAELIIGFGSTTDGLSTIITAEGTVDIIGQQKFGFHGIPHAELRKNSDRQEFRMNWVTTAGDSFVIDQGMQLFDIPGDFEHIIGDLRDPALVEGDTFGLITVWNSDRTALMVPRDFTSGSISGWMRYEGVALSSINPIEQVISWGPGEDQRVRIVVGSTGIPEPATCIQALVAPCLAMRRRRLA